MASAPQTIAPDAGVRAAIISPSKLAHIVLRTGQFDKMVDWYKTTLKAVPAFQSDTLAFLSYDDEHRRVRRWDPRPVSPHALPLG